MSRVLILFGTTDGQTRKIAAGLAAAIRESGCEVDVVEAKTGGRDADPARYDGVIVAASIHISAFQRPVRHWVRRHAAELNRRPTAFVAVCLGILEERPEARLEVLRIMQRFLDGAGWHPTINEPVAGALPYTRYGFIKRWAMKRKVAKISNDTDTTRDYEYTDWGALRELGHRFAALPGVAPPVPAGRP
jgi:menaquinone-dependent protoporphyrinogen oxidase